MQLVPTLVSAFGFTAIAGAVMIVHGAYARWLADRPRFRVSLWPYRYRDVIASKFMPIGTVLMAGGLLGAVATARVFGS